MVSPVPYLFRIERLRALTVVVPPYRRHRGDALQLLNDTGVANVSRVQDVVHSYQ